MESDLRVGGKWRSEGKNASGGSFAVWGEYTRIEPPNVLAFTWEHDWDSGPVTNVLIELSRTASGTRVKVTHSGFASEATRDDHKNGWGRVLAWLRRYLEEQ